ncbi:MAG TPA: glycosyltransferase family 2 protein [Phycisphaerae bacterium]|nr:glycosyltransferase family 2 protein [Phycisphaerae bacterium]
MTVFIGTLLAAYALGVVSLFWHIRQTSRLVGQDASIPIPATIAADLPAIDVVVPVKDEEHNIAMCLEALLREDYPRARILVVNDRSTDGTAAAVQTIQNEHPQVKRVDITHLPAGAFGKPNAIETITPMLTGDIVFFIDSDIQVKPGCLAAVVGFMRANSLDWFAAYGEPSLTYFWERLLVPLFGAIAYSWYDPRKISDPNWPDAIGSGFMVARREAYLAIGGHGAVKDQYDEDSAMLRRAKKAGQTLSFVISPNLYVVKLYGNLARTIRGFNRTLIGGLKTIPRFLITVHALLFVSLLPYLLLIAIPLLMAAGVAVPFANWWLAVAGLHLVLSNILIWQIYRTAQLPLRTSLLHPIGSAAAIWICARAAGDLWRGKPITWRGTSYTGTVAGAAPADGLANPPVRTGP